MKDSLYEYVRFNIVGVMRGWVGVKVPDKIW